MSKLWIAHRNPSVRAALARAAGLSIDAIAVGDPKLSAFARESLPAVVALALSDDLAAELDFAEAVRERAPDAGLILLRARDRGAAIASALATRRIAEPVSILDAPPDPRRLRAELAIQLAHADAARRSTGAAPAATERERERAGAARRLRAYFDASEIPGLARALDPALRRLPLLVRGLPGSGRALLVEQAERARAGEGTLLRVAARELADASEISTRLRVASEQDGTAIRTVWIDEIDELSDAVQRRLADWIDEVALPRGARAGSEGALRWLATAGPDDLGDRLAPALARVFAPLTLAVPPLSHAGEAVTRIAEYSAREWSERFGGEPRRFRESALEALSALVAEPGWLERAELEAILKSTLAATTSPELDARDLRFPGATLPTTALPGGLAGVAHPCSPSPSAPPEPIAPDAAAGDDPLEAPLEAPHDRDVDPSGALLELTEALQSEPEPAAAVADPSWRRLARSLAHEIRNPLVSIRTFTELLPDHYADETFRARFKELVGQDVSHIQNVVTRLAQAAERDPLERKPVDVSALIERLLAARRETIVRRRLVVLCELERERPQAEADAPALELALGGLLDRALDALPDRGDLFLTTRRLGGELEEAPWLRLLLRHHDPAGGGAGGELDPLSHILEYVLAETIVTAQGGRMTIDPSLGPQTLIVIDLPAV